MVEGASCEGVKVVEGASCEGVKVVTGAACEGVMGRRKGRALCDEVERLCCVLTSFSFCAFSLCDLFSLPQQSAE